MAFKMIPKKIVNGLFLLVSLSVLAGCSIGPQKEVSRYFWPSPPSQPRIEYIGFYQVEKDLQVEPDSWIVEVILGKDRPDQILKSPADVASDGKGRVFVSDLMAKQVFVFDQNTAKVRELKNPAGETMVMPAPLGVAVDEDGMVYVTDIRAKQVAAFGADEKLIRIYASDKFQRPTGVAVDKKRDRVYVADSASHQIVVFNLAGEEVASLGKRGTGPGEYNFPVDIDVDKDGNLYVLDAMNARVQVLDVDGKFVRMFGERGTAQGSFQIPKGVAVSELGHVYVTDGLAHKVVVFSAEGELLLSLGGRDVFTDGKVSPGGFYMPRGLDVDAGEAVWVVDSLNVMLHQFQFLTPAYLEAHPISEDQIYRPPGR